MKEPKFVYNDPTFDQEHHPITDFQIRSITKIPDILGFKVNEPEWDYTATVHGGVFMLDVSKIPHGANANRLNIQTMLDLINLENYRWIETDQVNGTLTIALEF